MSNIASAINREELSPSNQVVLDASITMMLTGTFKTQKYFNISDQWNGVKVWEEEPDNGFFIFNDLPCFIVRTSMGSLNGYVGFTKEHFFFGKEYSSCEELNKISIHGGWTFSGHFAENENVWWIGFDTSHYGDVVPGMVWFRSLFDHAYRTFSFMQDQLKNATEEMSKI